MAPPQPPLPPPTTSRVPVETINRAVKALLKWKSNKQKTQKPQLLPSDEFLYLVLTLKKIPPRGRTNPYRISLPHALYATPDAELCLFIDDRHGRVSSQAAKEKIAADGVPISKVIKLSKLKSDYKPFEAKRKLCDSYDMFFADRRVIPLLPKLIGKHFFKKRKIPVAVELGHKNWKEQIERVCSSALLYLKTGTCCVVRVAKAAMEVEDIVENVVAAIDGVAEVVPKKWSNVRSLHLKFAESLALPVYQSVPDMKLKIGGLVESKAVVAEKVNGNGEEDGELSEKEKKKESKKGRIHEVRYMDQGFGEMVGEDESSSEDEVDFTEGNESENDELGSGEIVGRKRKKVDGSKDKKLAKRAGKVKKSEKGLGDKGEKTTKNAVKVKKGEKGLKQKKAAVMEKSVGQKKSKKIKAVA